MPSIVVIEDESDISRVIELNLVAEGYSVNCADNGAEGLSLVRSSQPDLVLLDLMLPEINGLDICRALKSDKATRGIPVIMVSAKGEESDVVLGLGLGAEDYITKPFHISVLVARVQAAFRRRNELLLQSEGPDVVAHGGIELDKSRHALSVDGSDVPVTATEFRLLDSLMTSHGRVYSRDLLIDLAIGDDVLVSERTIDSHISTLRNKLGRYRRWLKTVWGVGYRFEPEQADGPSGKHDALIGME